MTDHSTYNKPNREEKVYSLDDIDASLTYSYANYLTWLFDDRVELLNGKLFKMSAPSPLHQEISGNLFSAFHRYLKGKPCKAVARLLPIPLTYSRLNQSFF